MSFNKKLKELRMKNNETQQELADVLKISFQSVSKWEKGQNLPSMDLIKEIAQHYNVSLDYLLDNKEIVENKEKFIEYHPTINKASSFSIFLDKDKMYPARLVKDRYRTDAEHNHRASDDINSYVIAVDSKGKIIYLCLGTGHCKGSPCDPFYHSKDIIEARDLECFYLLDTYRPFQDGTNPEGFMDFEFIIPKDGFIITINNKAFEKRTLFSFLLKGEVPEFVNDHVDYQYLFKTGNLECFHLSFENNTLKITYNEHQDDGSDGIINNVLKKSLKSNKLDNEILNKMFKEFLKENKKEIIELVKNEIVDSLEEKINEALDNSYEALSIAEDALAIIADNK